MPLSDALNLSSGRSSDPAPIAEELISNITRILATSDPAADNSYDVGAVFTGVVYALRSLELRAAHLDKVLAQLRGDFTMLERRILALEETRD